MIIEPSDAERAAWPDATRAYVEALEAQIHPPLIPRAAIPAPPWPAGFPNNSKRAGWEAYFEGRAREACPFPLARPDLQVGYRDGWDAAKASVQ